MKIATITATTTYILPMLRMKSISSCANNKEKGMKVSAMVVKAFLIAFNMVKSFAVPVLKRGQKSNNFWYHQKK